MGLYNKYEFPHMYTSPELGAATQKLVDRAQKNNVILGLFLFGTSRVGEFLEKGFTFISIGNDLHHVLTQAGAYVNDMENICQGKRQGLDASDHGTVLEISCFSNKIEDPTLFAENKNRVGTPLCPRCPVYPVSPVVRGFCLSRIEYQ